MLDIEELEGDIKYVRIYVHPDHKNSYLDASVALKELAEGEVVSHLTKTRLVKAGDDDILIREGNIVMEIMMTTGTSQWSILEPS